MDKIAPNRRRDLLLLGLASIFAPAAVAQSFPSKPIHIIVPYAPGGLTDLFVRLLATALEKRWGQPAVVEPRPGGGTVIGTAAAAKASPDGHTLLIIANTLVINAKLQKSLPYDGMHALLPIAILLDSPQVFVVNAASPHRSLSDWLTAARARAGALSVGTVGPATTQHIAIEMLKKAAKFDPIYVPHAGGAPAISALVGGHIDAVLANYGEVAQYIDAGKLRPLAVATPQRIDMLKDIPTIAESGYPGFEVSVWFGVASVSGTPNAFIARLAEDFGAALQDPVTVQGLAKLGLRPAFRGPQAAADYIALKYEQFSHVIDEAGIKLGD
jgi:tripartite-type tricarboxylate transporter receptor subunit TctC